MPARTRHRPNPPARPPADCRNRGWGETRWDAALEPHPALIVSMSLRPGIPWRVALPRSPPPLPRPWTGMQYRVGKANLFQRTATCPLFRGLTKRPHCNSFLSPSLARFNGLSYRSDHDRLPAMGRSGGDRGGDRGQLPPPTARRLSRSAAAAGCAPGTSA